MMSYAMLSWNQIPNTQIIDIRIDSSQKHWIVSRTHWIVIFKCALSHRVFSFSICAYCDLIVSYIYRSLESKSIKMCSILQKNYESIHYTLLTHWFSQLNINDMNQYEKKWYRSLIPSDRKHSICFYSDTRNPLIKCQK